MLQIGLNPYGFAHTVGLQAFGTPRANPDGTGLRGFIRIAREIGARCLEFDGRWLAPLKNDELAAIAQELPDVPRLCSYWVQHKDGETLDEAIRATRAIGAGTIRMHLTPVLEGARAKHGEQWRQMVDHARETLNREARKAADAGLEVAIENHQDFCSEELMALAEGAGRWHCPRHGQSVRCGGGSGGLRETRRAQAEARASEGLRFAVHQRRISSRSLSYRRRLRTSRDATPSPCHRGR